MSFLVSIPRNAYPHKAFDAFRATSEYSLENARAMMWMSQLAYETEDKHKVKDILDAWGFALRELIFNPPGTLLPLKTACAIVAGGRGATILAFAGTDPIKINDWITDFDTLPSADSVHMGFEAAIVKIWPRIAFAIANRPPKEQELFVTGHSLGGALAIVAAAHSLGDSKAKPTAIYTYGCPRVGAVPFGNVYTPILGDMTYRLVNATDIVPTVPPSLAGFRHVGRCIQCSSGERFGLETSILPVDSDKPDFTASLFTSVQLELKSVLAGKLFSPTGQGLLGQFIAVLPRQIRDHVPASYFSALAA